MSALDASGETEKLVTDLTSLFALPSLAARYIEEHGWVQGVEQNSKGEVCLTGALRLCSPVPGDGAIARAVFQHRGHAERWNDAGDRTRDEVVGYLARTEITDADLEEAFGPQWLEVVGIIRQVATATNEQIDALAASWDAASNTARVAASDAASDAARNAAWFAASDAAWFVSRVAAWFGARDAARDALLATVTRDLIGTNNSTQEHHDLLMAPWRAVFGEVQP